MQIIFDSQVNTYADFLTLARKMFRPDEIFYVPATGSGAGAFIIWAISREWEAFMSSTNVQQGHVTTSQVVVDFPLAVQLTFSPTFS